MPTHTVQVVVPAAVVDLWFWWLGLAVVFLGLWVLRWLNWLPGVS